MRFPSPLGARAALVLCLLAGVASGSTARAQSSAPEDAAQTTRDAEARSLFEAGRTAFAAGRFEAALERFREAYELSGRPGLLFNIGSAADRLRRDAEALQAFRAYLDAVPDAANRAEFEARIRVLEEAAAEDASRGEPGAPSPEDTARAAQAPPPDAALGLGATGSELERDSAGGGSVLEEWWFWTIVVVVGAGVGIGVGVAMADPGTQGPLPGTGGAIAIALGGR